MFAIFKLNLFLLSTVILITSCTTSPPTYDRSDWGGWKTRSCINTRHLLLKKRSIKTAKLDPRGCRVLDGTWIDFYTGEKINLGDYPQIDHVIPLKHAHTLGAHKWPRYKKNTFYNDHGNLVITSRSMNLRNEIRILWTGTPSNIISLVNMLINGFW